MRPEQLGYTQSAVSLQIAALERAAGTRLLERPGGRKPVVPTDAGARMLRHAARLSAQLQAAEAELTALAEGTANTLRVGTFQSVSISVLPDAVRRLIEERPGIEVRLHEASRATTCCSTSSNVVDSTSLSRSSLRRDRSSTSS